METFRVVKISQQFNGAYNVAPSRETVIVPDAGDRESAMVLAEVAASEHAESIFVDYRPCGNLAQQTGFTFRTNNGTDVWYVVKAND